MRLFDVVAAGMAGILAIAPASVPAQAAPAQPEPAPASVPSPATPVHRHRHRHTARHPLTQAPSPVPPPARSDADAAGTTPAPVPNEDIGPPRVPPGTSPSLDPGSLHLHYPPLGDGYLPGSSPQDMANSQTPKVPGATYTVPLQQAAPQPLPPPGPAH